MCTLHLWSLYHASGLALVPDSPDSFAIIASSCQSSKLKQTAHALRLRLPSWCSCAAGACTSFESWFLSVHSGLDYSTEGSDTVHSSVQDFEIHQISRGFLDFTWISHGFLDFTWISCGFLDFKWISLNFTWISAVWAILCWVIGQS